MQTKPCQTRVLFRLFKGEVLALFPAIAGNTNPDFCLSYAHEGQHGTAHYYGVMRSSRPATSKERDALCRELLAIGYQLEIVYRSSRSDYLARAEQCAR